MVFSRKGGRPHDRHAGGTPLWAPRDRAVGRGRYVGSCEPQRKRAAAARRALDRYGSSLELGQEARDREAETGAAERATARLIDAVEAVEDAFDVLGRDAWPRIRYAHTRHRAVRAHRQRDAPARGVAHRVGGEAQADVPRP